MLKQRDELIKAACKVIYDNYYSKGRGLDQNTKIIFGIGIIIVRFENHNISYEVEFNLLDGKTKVTRIKQEVVLSRTEI